MTTPSDKSQENSEYQIYLMRHGVAMSRGTNSSSEDAKRKLTPEGQEKMEKIAKGLLRLGVEFDWIVTSPLVRAVETGRIVGEAYGGKIPTDTCDALSPGKRAEDLLSYLAKQPERRRILLVGHEPDLGILAGRFLGAGPNANLTFKKGGCCLITCERLPVKSHGNLVWWLTPRVLRALA